MERNWLAVIAVLVGLSLCCLAAETQPVAPSLPTAGAPVMDQVYPGLASSVLTYARLTDLPEGILVRSGDFTVSAKTVKEEIANAPEAVQGELTKQSLFMLEQIAARDLLFLEAKLQAAKAGTDISKSSESEIMRNYFAKVVESLKVTDEEVAAFYRDNSAMFGGANLEQVKPQLSQYLLQQKQGEAVSQHIRTVGQRMPIEVSASWVKAQVGPSMDNPVGKARQSGRPSMVDFGSKGCGPCDMMAPILAELKQAYEGKANVLFIQVTEQQILAARYGIEAIPVQVFFDKDGKEVFRHTGFFPKDKIEKKLTEMGVK